MATTRKSSSTTKAFELLETVASAGTPGEESTWGSPTMDIVTNVDTIRYDSAYHWMADVEQPAHPQTPTDRYLVLDKIKKSSERPHIELWAGTSDRFFSPAVLQQHQTGSWTESLAPALGLADVTNATADGAAHVGFATTTKVCRSRPTCSQPSSTRT
ncbi:hypothetical protein [Streptosporangium lutulentum]